MVYFASESGRWLNDAARISSWGMSALTFRKILMASIMVDGRDFGPRNG
jgi:hypothetical protein